MKRIIGVDVGKEALVIYVYGKYITICNEAKAIHQFLRRHEPMIKATDLVVFEATGGYERQLRDCLIEAAIPYHLAHPNKVRDFAKSQGYLAKTDNIDAKVITEYGEQSRGVQAEKPLPSQAVQALRQWLDRRLQLVEERKREENRLEQTKEKVVRGSIKRHIDWINQELEAIEEALKRQEKEDDTLRENVELLTSIPGIGDSSAWVLLAYLPELGERKINHT